MKKKKCTFKDFKEYQKVEARAKKAKKAKKAILINKYTPTAFINSLDEIAKDTPNDATLGKRLRIILKIWKKES